MGQRSHDLPPGGVAAGGSVHGGQQLKGGRGGNYWRLMRAAATAAKWHRGKGRGMSLWHDHVLPGHDMRLAEQCTSYCWPVWGIGCRWVCAKLV